MNPTVILSLLEDQQLIVLQLKDMIAKAQQTIAAKDAEIATLNKTVNELTSNVTNAAV